MDLKSFISAGGRRSQRFKTSIYSIIVMLIVVLASPFAAFGQGPQGGPDMTLDARTRTEVVEGIIKQLNDHYVFPETAKKMEQALRERMQKKEYDQVTSARQFAGMLTEHLQAVSHDKHIRVNYSAEPIRRQDERGEPTPEEREQYLSFLKRINFGFEKIERLPGNIGYLDLRGFVDASLGSETATAAMSLLSSSDALIVDLRRNGGGDPAMVALITSYLFGERPVHLNDLYWREGDSTHQWWTLPYVPGKRLGEKKPVYVLTSRRTFSAAEEFTYNLKNLKRATIVGETTGGGAHPGGRQIINEHFAMFVPGGRAINPISKTNWEGTGVKPDIEVAADQALKTAQVDALRKLTETASDQEWKNQLKSALANAQRELDEMKNAKADTASASTQPVSSGPAIPATPAGQKFAAWLAAFNQGNVDVMKRFHTENAAKQVLERNPADKIAGMDKQFFEDTGGLKLHSIVKSTDNEIEVLAQAKNGDWVQIRITVEPSSPNNIIGLAIQPGSGPMK